MAATDKTWGDLKQRLKQSGFSEDVIEGFLGEDFESGAPSTPDLALYWLLTEQRTPYLLLPPGRSAPAPAPEPTQPEPYANSDTSTDALLDELKALSEDKDPEPVYVPEITPEEAPFTEYSDDPPEQEAADRPSVRKYIPVAIGIIAVLLLLLLLRACNGTEWSAWADTLPANVTADNYIIEEKTLYSSRSLETTSSSDKSVMPGWELYSTVEANGGYGAWSNWSETKVEASGTRQVETQPRYRYADKETTTSTASSMAGWTQYNTTYAFGNYGSWSGWSTSAAYSSDSRQVETKTQYRYRSISYSSEYTSWGSWSSWSFDRQSTSDLKKEESRKVWGYYYYTCPKCGAHMHGWNMYCPTWAGGCGKGWIQENMWTQVYSTTSWDAAGLKDWYGTGKYYTYIDGQLVFKWTSGGSGTQYRYATRSTRQVANYGSWSGWGDTPYSSSSSRDVQTRTVYRYRDRASVPTYHFYRWGPWSQWSETQVTANDNRQVETTTFYRYRDQIKNKTYYFRRWTDWSEYSETAITPSDTVEVNTKTQYRYKKKP